MRNTLKQEEGKVSGVRKRLIYYLLKFDVERKD